MRLSQFRYPRERPGCVVWPVNVTAGHICRSRPTPDSAAASPTEPTHKRAGRQRGRAAAILAALVQELPHHPTHSFAADRQSNVPMSAQGSPGSSDARPAQAKESHTTSVGNRNEYDGETAPGT